MATLASPTLPPSEQAKQVLAYLSHLPSRTNDSYLFSPFLGFLRPTPRQVTVAGGDCADRSRLLVALLELLGIHAAKWALFSPDDIPDHAVVELDAEGGKMVVDGLFGLWFPRPGGGYYGIKEMSKDSTILANRVMSLRAAHARPGADSLETYPLDSYIYTHPRSINWEKSAPMRMAYRVLHALIGDRVDLLPRPALAEQPALMLIVLLAFGECGFLFVLFVLNRRARPKATPALSKSS
jgi:hypothetical protein